MTDPYSGFSVGGIEKKKSFTVKSGEHFSTNMEICFISIHGWIVRLYMRITAPFQCDGENADEYPVALITIVRIYMNP